jgi:hypothetical protein
MNTENMIEVTGRDYRKMVQKAYEFSKPQGLGYLHYTSEPLSDDEADELIDETNVFAIVSLDYVKGRSCKFTIYRDAETGKAYIKNSWYDHSDHALQRLLEETA